MRKIIYIKHASDYQGNVVGFVNSWINLLGRAVYSVPLGKIMIGCSCWFLYASFLPLCVLGLGCA